MVLRVVVLGEWGGHTFAAQGVYYPVQHTLPSSPPLTFGSATTIHSGPSGSFAAALAPRFFRIEMRARCVR